MITYFKTITDTSAPFYKNVTHAIERIRNGNSNIIKLIEDIRNESDKAKRNVLKKKLPAICFSGKFTKRDASSCLEHSGFICIDFDKFDSELDMMSYRMELCEDPYSYAVFTSPSGDGLKVLVKIPKDIPNHKNYFLSLEKHYNSPQFDKSCKDISRVCYESYDPEIFVNENSIEWTEINVEEHTMFDTATSRDTIKLGDQTEIVRRLILWWNRDHGMVDGEKNNNLFILCSAMNDFGVPEDEARSVVMMYDEGGKEQEINAILRSAYKNSATFGTKFFEDTDKVNAIKELSKQGTPTSELIIMTKGVSADVVQQIAEENDEHEFWIKNSKGAVKHVNHLYKEYLESLGYYKYYPAGGRNFVFVNVNNNTIRDITDDMIKDTVLENLYRLDDRSIYNYFADKTKLFKEDHLSFLSKIEPMFVRDDENTAYLYYQNCAVKVTANGYETIDYMDIEGFVWEAQKIGRNFTKVDGSNAVFKQFIARIGGGEEDRIHSIESTAGYLMHSYKPSGYCPAVIINDEVISDNPEGGTGKGIYMHAVSQIKKNVIIDGKGFSFNKSFAYQRVSADTQLLTFDDVTKNFEFERLFPVITEGVTLEKKNKDEIFIPFKDSPKIVITTNYAIKGTGNSFDRRKWELEFAQHYNKNFTPEDEFGHQLFSGWDDCEWQKFDNYMISNLQMYLSKGLMKSKFKNLRERHFIAATSMDFYEWASDKNNELTRANTEHTASNLYDAFTTQYPDYGIRGKYTLPQKKFYQWIDQWGEFMYNTKPYHSRTSIGKTIRFDFKMPEQGDLFKK